MLAYLHLDQKLNILKHIDEKIEKVTKSWLRRLNRMLPRSFLS